ncbi:MAG: DnaA/Hda family protein [Hyphomicrobiaceae bacterium]
MTEPPRQLAFDLPQRPARAMEDFLVSASNAEAVGLIDRWPDWSHWAALVAGPEGTGKTHLAHVWQLKSGASGVPAAAIGDAAVQHLEQDRALLVEDIDRGIASEQLLFHLLNVARERRATMLLTSRLAPGEMGVTLPDLRSRLRALPVIEIRPPDDALLGGILVKLFADRQIEVDPQLVGFILSRAERSVAALSDLVAGIDRQALALKRRVTRQLVADVMREQEAGREQGAAVGEA